MKSLLLLPALILLSACVSNPEFDREQAYTKCESISDKSSRDRCIADVIREAERERARGADRQSQLEENAEQRELGRVIAGVEQD